MIAALMLLAAQAAAGPGPADPNATVEPLVMDMHAEAQASAKGPLSGFIEVEGRWFPDDSDDGVNRNWYGSVAAEPTLRFDSADDRHSLRMTLFGRLDTATDARTHADVREAKYVGTFGDIEAVIGIDRLFWGVTETVHLVNIVNQIDTLEDVDREDFLGQPLASVALRTGVGTFSAYLMPWFREREFPGRKDRPNAPLPVDEDAALFQSSDGDDHVDWALRWQVHHSGFDLGLSFFSGTDRDPQFVPIANGTAVAPYYELIDQAGIDAQWSLGSLALKLEAINRWADSGDYGAVAAGFEYTIGSIGGSGSDLGILSEYLWNDGDGRGPSGFEDDIMVGLRWSGNDSASTELLAVVVFDTGGDGTAINIEGSRRFGSSMRASIDARLFSQGVDDQLVFLRDDSFVQVKLQYYF